MNEYDIVKDYSHWCYSQFQKESYIFVEKERKKNLPFLRKVGKSQYVSV